MALVSDRTRSDGNGVQLEDEKSVGETAGADIVIGGGCPFASIKAERERRGGRNRCRNKQSGWGNCAETWILRQYLPKASYITPVPGGVGPMTLLGC